MTTLSILHTEDGRSGLLCVVGLLSLIRGTATDTATAHNGTYALPVIHTYGRICVHVERFSLWGATRGNVLRFPVLQDRCAVMGGNARALQRQ
jgi:hypothetical protein